MQTTVVLSETLVFFSQRSAFPGKPDRSTIHRWTTSGKRCPLTGRTVTLEWALVGSRKCTSREAVSRFLKRINGEMPANH